MTQLRTSMIIDLTGNLSSRANQFLGSIQRLGTGGSRSMQIMQRSVHAAGQGLDKLGNRYTAMLTGGGGLAAIKQVGDLSQRMTRLGLDADASAEQVERLKNKVFEAAQMKDIRVDPGQIFSGVEAIVSKIGDWKLAEDQVRNIGLAIRATGADGQAVGAIIADLNQKMKIAPEDMLKSLTIIRQAGKAGSFEMKDFVTQGPKVAAAMATSGRTGVAGLKEMMAIMQVFRSSAGTPEDATTAFKNFFNDLIEPQKQKLLQANKIQIFDPESLKQGKFKWRSPIDIMDEIIKKTQGDPRKWGQILGMQTRDGFNAVMSEWQASGTNPMRKFMEVPDDPKLLLKEAGTAAGEFNAAIQNLNTSWQKFASSELTKPVKDMADYLNNLKPGTVDRWLNMAKYAALVGGGILAARKGFNAYQWSRTNIFGKGGAAGGLGKGPSPVLVTNMPKNFNNPAGLYKNTGGLFGSPVPAARTIGLGTASIIGLPFVTAAVARPIGKALAGNEASWSSNGRLQDLLSRQLVMGGGPSSFQAKLIVDELTKRAAPDVNGTIKIVIDNQGAVRVKEIKSHNSGVSLDVYSGLTMRY